MDYMRQNCARTCGFCFVGDSIDHENDNIAGLLSSLSSSNVQKSITSEHANERRNMHRLIESWRYYLINFFKLNKI